MNKRDKKILLSVLDSILIDAINNPSKLSDGRGICAETEWRLDRFDLFNWYGFGACNYFQQYFTSWVFSSGNHVYPVPGGSVQYLSPGLWRGRQLQYRISLLCHLIREIHRDINKEYLRDETKAQNTSLHPFT